MNIIINAVVAFEKPHGVGRYLNNLIPALAQIDINNDYYIYFGKWMREYEFLEIKQSNFHFIELNISKSKIIRNFYLAVILPIRCKKNRPDLFFLIDTQAIILKPCKIVSTIHDLAEFEMPIKYSVLHAFIRRQIVREQIKYSDHILTVSSYSKKNICSRFGIEDGKVTVVYNSLDIPRDAPTLQKQNYFLFVSEIERSKNLSTLIKAYCLLPKKIIDSYKLFVVGNKGNDYENVMKLIRNSQIENRVRFFGFVSDEQLGKLYAEASCFVFPSLFEGFGFPVLEAMSRGTPVICSKTSSIPEVGGDAILSFCPSDEKEISFCMLRVVNDEELRRKMVSKGLERVVLFDKESAARETLSIFERVIG